MKYLNYLIIIIFVLTFSVAQGQSTFIDFYDGDPLDNKHSWDGFLLRPDKTYRFLTIFVNVIYDQPPVLDPEGNNQIWGVASTEGVFNNPYPPSNEVWPAYIHDYLDIEFDPQNLHGTLTRLYAESSFNNLKLLGDFVLVNVKHSTISDGGIFSHGDLTETVMNMINLSNNGQGLNTVHGFNSISDYSTLGGNQFDHVMFIFRNTKKDYGNFGAGNGTSGSGSFVSIKTSEQNLYSAFSSSIQCVGSMDLYANPKTIATHEFSHLLFGTNSFHTGGGHSWGRLMCFLGIQYGYGLMGGASSGLVNCNGYDRYRVGWMHPDNEEGWPITALDANSLVRRISDITKADGNQSFKLDNFITTGDVVRIKLPYIESPASNQYIWLENHKVLESTLNFLQYSNTDPICRPQTQKGIYAYYQVGKDTLEGPQNIVYPYHDADNLRFICANGFYEQFHEGLASTPQCPANKMHFRDIGPNTLSGNNDLSSYYIDISEDVLIPEYSGMAEAKTYFNCNEPNVKQPYLMSEINPFHGHTVMSINTNPAPFNSVTYYHEPSEDDGVMYTEPIEQFRNQPDVILTGLKIEMTPLANDDYQVDISWDNYDLDSEVRWTGSILLKEELYLTAGSMLLLDQNLTPNTLYRNETTGLFAAPTLFRCDDGSQMFQQEGSELAIDNRSTLLIDDGSEFFANAGRLEVKSDAFLQIASGGYFEQNQDAEIYADNTGTILIEKNGYYLLDGGTLTIKTGGRLEIEGCATLEIKNGGLLVVEEDAVICVHPGAILDFESTNNYSFDPNFSTGECVVFDAQNFLEAVLAEPPTYSITGTVVWDDVIYNFTDDLHIEPGAQLMVEGGSMLRFGLDKRIKVKAGAICIVDGSVLSSLCSDDVWQGVEVYGDNNKSQYPDAQGTMFQGRLIVRNGSLIENARIAALAGMTASSQEQEGESEGVPNPEIVYGTKGGIIMATSSTFKNNQTGIYLPEYENYHHSDPQTPLNNLSYIRNCDFIWDDGLYTGLETEAFLKLVGVRGITIGGSHFLQQSSQTITGIGIISLKSSFTVEKACADYQTPCTNFRLCRFENLEYGVKALGPTAKNFMIDTAQFFKNFIGIYTSEINNFAITRNVFEIEKGVYLDYCTGIYFENKCNGIQVEENEFYGDYTGSFENPKRTYGVIFNNTVEYNLLYRNYFEKMHVAVHSIDRNRNSEDGLCIKCNTFVNNGKDIEVLYSTTPTKNGIAPQQGSSMVSLPNAPAGNRFSRAGSYQNPGEIYNECMDIDYVYHAQASPELNLEPIYITTATVFTHPGHHLAYWNPIESCPSNLPPPGGGHDEQTLRGMMAEAEQGSDSTQTLINMLKDAGDTEALHWDVSMSASWQSMEVYSELMSVSPYVSDTVLAAAIEKENVLPNAMIRDVMVANTHSAKSSDLMQMLEQRIQPLPDYMVEEIMEGRSLISVYEELKSGLLYFKRTSTQYQNQLAQLYLKDTLNTAVSTDSLVNLYLSSGQAGFWYQAAFLRHEQNKATDASDILNSIPATFNLAPEQLAIHNDVVLLLEQAGILQGQEKSLMVPDSLTVAWLLNLMESGTQTAHIFARNILWAHGIVAHDPVYLLPDENKSQIIKSRQKRNPSPQAHLLKLFPNPAREYVIIDFDISGIKQCNDLVQITISTIDGKSIETINLNKTRDKLVFSLNGYKPGIYLFTLYCGNQKVESKRLSVN